MTQASLFLPLDPCSHKSEVLGSALSNLVIVIVMMKT